MSPPLANHSADSSTEIATLRNDSRRNIAGTLFGSKQTGQQADRILNTIHIPFTIFQQAFNFNDRVGFFAIVGQPGVDGEELEEQVKATLKQRHKVAPDDDGAVGSWNTSKEFRKMNMLFFLINVVMWVAGTMCLFAGVVGVSTSC